MYKIKRKIFTFPSNPPNPVSQSHPQLRSRPPAEAFIRFLPPSLVYDTDITHQTSPHSNSQLYFNHQIQQAFPWNQKAIPVSQAGRLTTEKFSLSFSKATHPVLIPALQLTTCFVRASFSVLIPRRLSKSWWPLTPPLQLLSIPTPVVYPFLSDSNQYLENTFTCKCQLPHPEEFPTR